MRSRSGKKNLLLKELVRRLQEITDPAETRRILGQLALWSRDAKADKLTYEEFEKPHFVTRSHEGEIVLEWFFGGKKLTVYFSADRDHFIKVWGPNIQTDMEDGEARDHLAVLAAWRWLTT